MATLVQFLAAGVNGAQSGTATFLMRGSASSAAAFLFNDFERTAQPGTNIIVLDANGAAEIYCSVYCDVTVKNAAGATLRTVTIGNSSGVVEVRSDSFTGSDYDGDPFNAVNQPVTLTEVLNRWNDSAGSTNFQVSVGGVATNISTALASFAGIFTNVKDPEYGAQGDGVTDDTTAINAAIAASNGGIVFFPPGTYIVSSLGSSTPNVNLMGSGAGATIISGSGGGSGAIFSPSDITAGSWKNIQGIKFVATGACQRILGFSGGQNVTIKNCDFDGTNCSAEVVRFLGASPNTNGFITDCNFTLPDGATFGIGAGSFSIAGNHKLSIKGCTFTVPVGFTGTVVEGCGLVVSDCVFDASAVTSGVYNHIDAADAATDGTASVIYRGIVTGCRFIDGGSTGFVFDLTSVGAGSDFTEDHNLFIGFVQPVASGEVGHIYLISLGGSFSTTNRIELGSRKGKAVHLTNAAGTTLLASAILVAEYIVIEHVPISTLTVTVPSIVPGLSGRIVVFVVSGAEVGIDFVDSAGFGAMLSSAEPDEVLVGSGASGQVTSCGYLTTSRADGTLRSLITSEVNHHL